MQYERAIHVRKCHRSFAIIVYTTDIVRFDFVLDRQIQENEIR